MSLGFSVMSVFKQVFGMGFFSRRVTSAVSFCFSIHVSVFCDASDYAFGGYRIKLNDQPVSGMFSQFESRQSSTFRELKAIFYVIEAHVASLRHKKVKFSRVTRMPLGLSQLAALSSIVSV